VAQIWIGADNLGLLLNGTLSYFKREGAFQQLFN
jgi:hypothetical protein